MATIIPLLPELLRRGYIVRTSFRPNARGCKVHPRAKQTPVLVWNGEVGGAARVVNDTIVGLLYFGGDPRVCEVPLKAVTSWSAAR